MATRRSAVRDFPRRRQCRGPAGLRPAGPDLLRRALPGVRAAHGHRPGQPGPSGRTGDLGDDHRRWPPHDGGASGPLALDLDEAQYRRGSGPCVDAATTGQAAEIVDTRRATEWTEFARLAADRGCGSVLSFPLPAQERVYGALNVYAWQFSVHDPHTRDLVSRFADYAVVPVSNMYLYESAVERAEHLAAALDSRAVIDQAKGILMERFKLTPDQAFQALTRVSMESNTKVRQVAERFVATGELRPS
ncbi:MAG TPA: GAF and ANTAR domain-containing protein [Pseudonocardiaceae bacterium]|nr:GAF and ANTAR domain-containing protein [Pseudonocardiaceae bacterium]